MRSFLLVPIVLWASVGQLVFADDSQEERETLRGMKSIGVLIGLDLRIQDAGVTTGVFRADIEARLRQANIHVIPKAVVLQRNMQDPTLIVNFRNTNKLGDVFSYKMELLLRQRVRDQSTATTWFVNRAGSIKAGEVTKIRATVYAAIDDFIKAYRSVNSAPQP